MKHQWIVTLVMAVGLVTVPLTSEAQVSIDKLKSIAESMDQQMQQPKQGTQAAQSVSQSQQQVPVGNLPSSSQSPQTASDSPQSPADAKSLPDQAAQISAEETAKQAAKQVAEEQAKKLKEEKDYALALEQVKERERQAKEAESKNTIKDGIVLLLEISFIAMTILSRSFLYRAVERNTACVFFNSTEKAFQILMTIVSFVFFYRLVVSLDGNALFDLKMLVVNIFCFAFPIVLTYIFTSKHNFKGGGRTIIISIAKYLYAPWSLIPALIMFALMLFVSSKAQEAEKQGKYVTASTLTAGTFVAGIGTAVVGEQAMKTMVNGPEWYAVNGKPLPTGFMWGQPASE